MEFDCAPTVKPVSQNTLSASLILKQCGSENRKLTSIMVYKALAVEVVVVLGQA